MSRVGYVGKRIGQAWLASFIKASWYNKIGLILPWAFIVAIIVAFTTGYVIPGWILLTLSLFCVASAVLNLYESHVFVRKLREEMAEEWAKYSPEEQKFLTDNGFGPEFPDK